MFVYSKIRSLQELPRISEQPPVSRDPNLEDQCQAFMVMSPTTQRDARESSTVRMLAFIATRFHKKKCTCAERRSRDWRVRDHSRTEADGNASEERSGNRNRVSSKIGDIVLIQYRRPVKVEFVVLGYIEQLRSEMYKYSLRCKDLVLEMFWKTTEHAFALNRQCLERPTGRKSQLLLSCPGR